MARACMSLLMWNLVVFMSFFYVAFTSDPSPLQDFCVANYASVSMNGFACKDASLTTPNDFLYRGAHIPGNTSNHFGANTTQINVISFPGLNTQGISMTRLDLAPFGVNPPHFHPRATEVITVFQGSVYAAFITSSPGNKLFGKILEKGDVFVIPKGLIHFQHNIENSSAVLFNFFNSQFAGVVQIGNNLFGSDPQISSEVLTKAFQVDRKVVAQIESKF